MGSFTLHERKDDQRLDDLKILSNTLDALSPEEQQIFYRIVKDLSETGESNERQWAEETLFKTRPPTAEEVLDPRNEWLPASYTKGIFPEIREDIIEMFDYGRHYNYAVDYGATGVGKSLKLRLIVMISTIFYHHLRNPMLYYDIAESTALCMYFVSYKMDKARQLLLEPIFKLFRLSPRFEHVNLSQKVFDLQPKYGTDKLIWSKAAYNKDGHVTLASGLKYYLGNDNPDEIRGADIWQYYATEISYFVQQDGISEEQVFKLIIDAKNRLFRTMANQYLSWLYIDTSARSASSVIEKFLTENLQNDPQCFFRERRRWSIKKLREKQFPIYSRDPSQVFEVIIGDGSTPAKIVKDESEKSDIRPELIKQIPIDTLKVFEEDLVTNIRDIAGYPTSDESKFIQNIKIINQMFDNPALVNVPALIIADAGENPEKQIWNQIHEMFFVKSFDGRYSFKRAPREPRFIGYDLAKSNKGDLVGTAMCHREWSNQMRCVVTVFDFCFGLGFGEVGISLQAQEEFVMDLIREGNVNIHRGYLDTALSAQIQQNLNRRTNRDLILSNSVDRDMNDYQNLLSGLHAGTIKAGRNIFLLNNLMCLERKKNQNGKEKVDHPEGKVTYVFNNDWEKSEAGKNMKDVSDAMCQALAAMKSVDLLPSTIYEEENSKFISDTGRREQDVKKAFTLIGKL